MSTRRFAPLASLASVAAAAVAACYGSGPEPAAPSSVKVLWQPTAGAGSCGAVYVGPVAIGSSSGYAIAMPYAQTGCFNVMRDVAVSTFPLDGSSPAGSLIPQGQAGTFTADTSFEVEPELSASGSAVAFVYQGSMATIGPTQSPVGQADGSSSTFLAMPTAIAFDKTSLFFALSETSGIATPVDPFSPSYPHTTQQFVTNVVGSLWRVDWPPPSNASATQHWVADTTFSCGELEHCLVANSTDLLHLGLSPAGDAIVTINAVAKAGGPESPIATVLATAVGASAVPVGLVADDTRVVLVMANAPATTGNAAIAPGCWVFSHDFGLPAAPMTLLFQSTQLSCMGAALDATHVYVALVHSDNPTCDGCTPPIHGDGVGRILRDGPNTFESIAFEMNGPSAGPRRVYLTSPDSLIVVDPTTVAAVPTSAFPNKHDFTP